MEERLPRSAPDALRYEPGVAVQQTAHGQASPYVRGMTGQQVAHVFDGVRMNHGIYRQGPNQYFFTVDAWTLDRIEVVRGSASTHHGSDALGGAILAFPREPTLTPGTRGVEAHPALFGRFASADMELGGRVEGDLSLDDHTGALLGIGYRDLDRLESGGVVRNSGRRAPFVPRFENDGRTQLGTGFEEATFDARVRHRFRRTLELVGALYGFREFDAPRTDQCPPPEAPIDECLTIAEQFRTFGYLTLRGNAGDAMRDIQLQVSWQEHSELRINDRPRSFVQHTFDNAVRTLGASVRGASTQMPMGQGSTWRLHYGADGYRDEVASNASQRLTDPELAEALPPDALEVAQSRGQYLDGSTYLSGGAFAELELVPIAALTLRGGGRAAAVGAQAPGDPLSGTSPVRKRWGAVVGRAGAEVRPLDVLGLHLNVDQGFRAPNLDDLTSRQEVGPGFQFENPDLRPERTDTLEFGAILTPGPVRIEGWTFATWLSDAITRTPREAADCPEDTPGCGASRTQYQLVNAADTTTILGAEGASTVDLPAGFDLHATVSYAWGEGPDTRPGRGDAFVPVSRIPPLQGTAEARWRERPAGFHAGAAMRWALAQDRLAPSDLSDARIPPGGTPGYSLFDLRAGWRFPPHLGVSLVFENLLDAAYRVHGSSINGPGRGLIAVAQGRL
jgi:iron complex outermembrane receptor protein/hemoglobin/transferrin/lactoferrin receptor protein